MYNFEKIGKFEKISSPNDLVVGEVYADKPIMTDSTDFLIFKGFGSECQEFIMALSSERIAYTYITEEDGITRFKEDDSEWFKVSEEQKRKIIELRTEEAEELTTYLKNIPSVDGYDNAVHIIETASKIERLKQSFATL